MKLIQMRIMVMTEEGNVSEMNKSQWHFRCVRSHLAAEGREGEADDVDFYDT
jgi:hypothetical protein